MLSYGSAVSQVRNNSSCMLTPQSLVPMLQLCMSAMYIHAIRMNTFVDEAWVGLGLEATRQQSAPCARLACGAAHNMLHYFAVYASPDFVFTACKQLLHGCAYGGSWCSFSGGVSPVSIADLCCAGHWATRCSKTYFFLMPLYYVVPKERSALATLHRSALVICKPVAYWLKSSATAVTFSR